MNLMQLKSFLWQYQKRQHPCSLHFSIDERDLCAQCTPLNHLGLIERAALCCKAFTDFWNWTATTKSVFSPRLGSNWTGAEQTKTEQFQFFFEKSALSVLMKWAFILKNARTGKPTFGMSKLVWYCFVEQRKKNLSGSLQVTRDKSPGWETASTSGASI